MAQGTITANSVWVSEYPTGRPRGKAVRRPALCQWPVASATGGYPPRKRRGGPELEDARRGRGLQRIQAGHTLRELATVVCVVNSVATPTENSCYYKGLNFVCCQLLVSLVSSFVLQLQLCLYFSFQLRLSAASAFSLSVYFQLSLFLTSFIFFS